MIHPAGVSKRMWIPTRPLYIVLSVDDGNVIAEYDDNGDLAGKYIHGARVDELLCMIHIADSNAVYYYHYDGLGSVVALSDYDGDSCYSCQYSAFGQPAASDPNFTANPYLFTGRRFDYETGLYYYRARYYNPYIGRFLQTDPIGYGDGINWYAYCGNNPLNFVDPSGLSVWGYVWDEYEVLELTGDWNFETMCSVFNIETEGAIECWDPCDPCAVLIYFLDRENYGHLRYGLPEEEEEVSMGSFTKIAEWEAEVVSETVAEESSEPTRIGRTYPLESPWSVAADAYSQACYGVLNAILGGLFETESGIPYMASPTVQEWSEGEAFQRGETGWRAAEASLLTAAGLQAGGVGSKIALHDAHHYFPSLNGNLPHLQLTIWRVGVSGSGAVVRIPIIIF